MFRSFLQSGNTIKIEVDTEPSYLYFRGKIKKVEKYIIVKLDIEYIQKEPQSVNCTIIDENSRRVCLFKTIIKKIVNNQLILIKPDEEDIEIVQRRQYIRVPFDKEVNCYLIGINGKKIESEKIFPARIKDISGGGVLLNSQLSLPLGIVLVFEMKIDDNPFLLTVKVLRKSEDKEDGINNFGCKFIGINDRDRQKIIAYCNKKQLILKRRRKI